MAKTPTDIRSLARRHTEVAINTLKSIMVQPKAPHAARVAAATALLDRGWGKPKQEMTIEHRKSLGQLTDAELEAIARGEPNSGEGVALTEDGPGQPDSVH